MGIQSLFFCPTCRKLQIPTIFCPECRTPLSKEPFEYLVGRSIGPYHVEGILGVGAVGIVYRVRGSLDAPAAALKLMFPDADDDAAQPRFLREAEMLRELHHPHIVRAREVGTSEWGPPYYTMECLEGRNLREVLRDHPKGLPLPEVLEHARQLGTGLQYAHDRGVIHRDLKPENVFVVPAGRSFTDKLLDFGFAKWVVGRRKLRLTADGDVVGTPAYLTPEQVGVAPPGPHTDQYALALVVAELLTGRKMRQGLEPFEIVTHEVQGPLPVERLAGPDLPPHVVRALVRATQRMPDDRFPDVYAFVEALEGRRKSSVILRRARAPRHKLAFAAMLLTFVALVAVAWILLGH
jgi:serine/threonine protein kinase